MSLEAEVKANTEVLSRVAYALEQIASVVTLGRPRDTAGDQRAEVIVGAQPPVGEKALGAQQADKPTAAKPAAAKPAAEKPKAAAKTIEQTPPTEPPAVKPEAASALAQAPAEVEVTFQDLLKALKNVATAWMKVPGEDHVAKSAEVLQQFEVSKLMELEQEQWPAVIQACADSVSLAEMQQAA